MAEFNLSQKEITFKIVYYGPALSGKTTNLQQIHRLSSPDCRGRLMTLETNEDRTLYFDLLPVRFKTSRGFQIKLKLFTVPGQVIHNSTRKLVLNAADGVVFVADSQKAQSKSNAESFVNMKENLRANNLDFERTPFVIQFNKRDLPEIVSARQIKSSWGRSGYPTFLSTAIHGEGVIETLTGLLTSLYRSVDSEYSFRKRFDISREDFLENLLRNFNR